MAHLEKLSSDYAEAWQEWTSDPDHLVWETTVADGLSDTDASL